VPERAFSLPPSLSSVIVTGATRCASQDMLVFAVRAHAHVRGVANRFTVKRRLQGGRQLQYSTKNLRYVTSSLKLEENRRSTLDQCSDSKNSALWSTVFAFERSTKEAQSFVPLENGPVLIRKGDAIEFECEYNTKSEKRTVREGSRHTDEMCNVYLQYRPWNDEENEKERLFRERQEILVNTRKIRISNDKVADKQQSALFGNLVLDEAWTREANEQLVTSGKANSVQVVGVSVGTKVVWVFHRGTRIWESDTFTNNNALSSANPNNKVPIGEDVIVALDPVTGKRLHAIGKGIFYMPHSVTEDPLGNGLWVTDVGLHQVLLLNSDNGQITRSFGERMVPGDDGVNLFCKPTHVLIPHLYISAMVTVMQGY
jgi:hypothetical protein